MPGRDIIVIGGSAGSLEPLGEIVSQLPPAAALFVVMHSPPAGSGLLPQIMQRQSPLMIRQAQEGEAIHHGHVYVAPPTITCSIMRVRGEWSTDPRRTPRCSGHLQNAANSLMPEG